MGVIRNLSPQEMPAHASRGRLAGGGLTAVSLASEGPSPPPALAAGLVLLELVDPEGLALAAGLVLLELVDPEGLALALLRAPEVHAPLELLDLDDEVEDELVLLGVIRRRGARCRRNLHLPGKTPQAASSSNTKHG